MSDTSIRVSTDAKARLDLFKREGESYDDVILRLTSTDPWAGFGIASGDAAEARDGISKIRSELRDSMADDIEGQR